MLRLFFHRDSLFVKLAFLLGALFTLLFFWQGPFLSLNLFQKTLLLFSLLQIGFAKVVEFAPWYPKESKGLGIRLQFQKALVPISYLWLLFSLLFWIAPSSALLILFNLLLLPMGIVACILIHFHRLDPEAAHPNPLSGSLDIHNTGKKIPSPLQGEGQGGVEPRIGENFGTSTSP